MRRYSTAVFPSSERRGGCASRKSCEATFESADEVVAHTPCFTTHSAAWLVSDRPGRATSERVPFLDATATPPLQGGECGLTCNSFTASRSWTAATVGRGDSLTAWAPCNTFGT